MTCGTSSRGAVPVSDRRLADDPDQNDGCVHPVPKVQTSNRFYLIAKKYIFLFVS